MQTGFVRKAPDGGHLLGNCAFQMGVALNEDEVPCVRSLTLSAQEGVDWAASALPLGPYLVIEDATYALTEGNVRFQRFEMVEGVPELRVHYTLDNGLEVTQHLQPSPDKPVWRAWVTLRNRSEAPVEGITRFDAVHSGFSASEAEPQCGYVLGWLEGPRVDAPGRPSIPYKYGGWIPKFLYGEEAVIPPPPAGGWAAPVYRLVQERLTRLPLRSGKRSTYENHPWVTVLDPLREGGWFLGFEWSGTWRIDVAHERAQGRTTVCAASDGNTHVLGPGEELVSPAAFLGLFAGDWDDAFNVCRFYVDEEVIPQIEPEWPTTLHVYHFHNRPEKQNEAFLRREIDAAVEAGFETTYVETIWWEEGAPIGEFSLGLGSFKDNRRKFPMGLRGMSDYCHSKGMNFGLWFEIERVDIRTANRLRNPWKPEWLVHQEGYPYRSWCQHAFMLCLGVKEAAEWALENLVWAVREYDIDYIMFDSNEWAVCDDPSHDHGAGDGEWAQIQGYYWVMRELRKAFPDLMIMNSSGGSQRGDFGIARYSNCIHPHDHQPPSAKQRRFMHGTGCMYPTSFQQNYLKDYTDQPSEDGFVVSQPRPPDRVISAERFEWRVLNRLLGLFCVGMEVSALPDFQREILKKANQFYKQIRKCTHGDRYVLLGPVLLHEPRYEESDNWEAYQYVAREGDMSVVYFYRCRSLESEFTARLKGLCPDATYSASFYTGGQPEVYTGTELMRAGFTCCLEHTRSAEIMLLRRV